MKSANDASKLAARYRSWATEDLVQATTLEAEEYTSEAIRLMRKELQERGLTPEAQGAIVDEAKREQKSLVGITGWLFVFLLLFAWNFASLLLQDVSLLVQSLPRIDWIIGLEILVSIYALGTSWFLALRHPKAPQHAQTVLAIFCLLAIGSWLVLYRGGLSPGPFPFGAVIFACSWGSYLSYSKRVRFTYASGTEDIVEAEVAQ